MTRSRAAIGESRPYGFSFGAMLGEFVERAQHVLDALHGAERIFGVQVCRIEAAAPDKEVRHRLAIEG